MSAAANASMRSTSEADSVAVGSVWSLSEAMLVLGSVFAGGRTSPSRKRASLGGTDTQDASLGGAWLRSGHCAYVLAYAVDRYAVNIVTTRHKNIQTDAHTRCDNESATRCTACAAHVVTLRGGVHR
eukprot:scaffold127184_cov84-Phaeocystis_antarctica.AAC.5